MDTSYYAEHDLAPAFGPNHDLAQELAFERAAADLQDIIHVIAERYLLRGVPLTWRLLHAIEAEALADLGLASRHDDVLLALFVRASTSDYPCTDEVVSVLENSTVPLLFWFVLDVYGIPAISIISSPKRTTRGFKPAYPAQAPLICPISATERR